MSHELYENDHMISVGETPWHRTNYTLLDTNPTVEEAITKAQLDWEVRMLNLQAIQPVPENNSGPFRTRLNVPAFKAIQRVDTGEIFTVLTDKYTPVQNREAFSLIQPMVDAGTLQLETAGSLKNGRIVWFLGKIAADPVYLQANDSLMKYVLLSTTHDGSGTFRIMFTFVRVVCNNTLQCAHHGSQSRGIKVLHRGGIHQSLEAVVNTMNLANRTFEATLKQYQFLASQRIVNQKDLVKYIRMVFPPPKPETDTTIKDGAGLLDAVLDNTPELDTVLDNTPEIDLNVLSRKEEAIIRVLESGKGAQARGGRDVTFWDAYNAVNEWGLYERGYDAGARLASSWFGQGAADDAKAFRMAVRAAGGKWD